MIERWPYGQEQITGCVRVGQGIAAGCDRPFGRRIRYELDVELFGSQTAHRMRSGPQIGVLPSEPVESA